MNPLRPMATHLATERLTLQPWADADAEAYHALMYERDPRAAAAPRAGRPTLQDVRDSIVRQRTSLPDTGIGLLTVRRHGEFIGWCGLVVGHASLEEPEIAYELFARFQGNGYATEAARAVLEAAVDTGRRRLWATVRIWNDASFRVLDKLGFDRTDRITTDDFGPTVWCTRTLP
ncbi:MAG TPA: GNAT family N-acetyltransferase [Mycobacteriales bacterium]|nr:GNAT family N-acetyltransferase [Mycobacteriales bacterium]